MAKNGNANTDAPQNVIPAHPGFFAVFVAVGKKKTGEYVTYVDEVPIVAWEYYNGEAETICAAFTPQLPTIIKEPSGLYRNVESGGPIATTRDGLIAEIIVDFERGRQAKRLHGTGDLDVED